MLNILKNSFYLSYLNKVNPLRKMCLSFSCGFLGTTDKYPVDSEKNKFSSTEANNKFLKIIYYY